MEYTELHCHSYYSFLDGTSSPADLAENAHLLSRVPQISLKTHQDFN